MPKGSEELTKARKDEIVNACAELYETKSFKEITLKDIGGKTSFTRTSIYNYFHTKEEIFLAILQREYEAWICDLDKLAEKTETLSADGFASKFSRALEKRKRMLKLLSMNIYEIESGSRMENLVEFKAAYGASLEAVSRCLKKFFPALTEEENKAFLYALFPFLSGAYPYSESTPKFIEAMKKAKVNYAVYSTRELIQSLVLHLLKSFGIE